MRLYCGEGSATCVIRWRPAGSRCTVIPMSDSGRNGQFYWCTRHHRVETDTDVCPAKHVLGPYNSAADAENALQRVQERNEAWEAEDARWAGDDR